MSWLAIRSARVSLKAGGLRDAGGCLDMCGFSKDPLGGGQQREKRFFVENLVTADSSGDDVPNQCRRPHLPGWRMPRRRMGMHSGAKS